MIQGRSPEGKARHHDGASRHGILYGANNAFWPFHQIPQSTQSAVNTDDGTILDLQALEDSADLINLAKARNKAAVVLNAVPSGQSRETAIRESLRTASRLKLEVAPERLSELPGFSQGLKSGRGVTETEKNGTAAKEITALYRALWTRDDGEGAEE